MNKSKDCYCLSVPAAMYGKFTCNACASNIIEDKNVIVKENQALEKQIAELKTKLAQSSNG